MYNPISSDFFDQLTVAMEREIPSKIEYYDTKEQEQNKDLQEVKAVLKSMKLVDGFEFVVLSSEKSIRLSWVVKFNGRRHRED